MNILARISLIIAAIVIRNPVYSLLRRIDLYLGDVLIDVCGLRDVDL